MKSSRSLCLTMLLAILAFAASLHAQPALRIINVVSGAPPLDAHLDSADAPVVSGIAYGYAGARTAVSPGNHHVTITTGGLPAGFGLLDTLLAFQGENTYNLFLIGSDGIDKIVTTYHRDSIARDSARVRFVDGALGGGAVDIAAVPGGENTIPINALPYGGFSSYITVPATDLTVKISEAGGAAIYRAFGYLTGGRTYTIVISGSGDSVAVYGFDESDTNAQTPMVQFTPLPVQEGAFRAVNVADGFGGLDLYLDSETATPLEHLAEQSAGPQTSSLLGTHAIHFSRSGAGAGNAIFTTDVTVPADTSVILFATSNSDGTSLGAVALSRALADRPTLGDIMVRVLNASPDLGTVTPKITLGDGTIKSGEPIGFQQATSFVEGAPGTVTIGLTTSGASEPFVVVGGGVNANRIATAVISGRRSNGTLTVRFLFESDDARQEPLLPLTQSASVAESRRETSAAISIAPNPVSGDAILSCRIGRAGHVRIALVNLVGERVALLADRDVESGNTMLRFSAAGIPTGYYTAIVTDEHGMTIATSGLMIAR